MLKDMRGWLALVSVGGHRIGSNRVGIRTVSMQIQQVPQWFSAIRNARASNRTVWCFITGGFSYVHKNKSTGVLLCVACEPLTFICSIWKTTQTGIIA
jgi:hypothetical protein